MAELEIKVDDINPDNIEIGDTILGIFSEEGDEYDEHYFAKIFDIDFENKTLFVAWEYDEDDINYEIDLDEVDMDKVYKVIDILEHKPTRKMPPKTLDILEKFK